MCGLSPFHPEEYRESNRSRRIVDFMIRDALLLSAPHHEAVIGK